MLISIGEIFMHSSYKLGPNNDDTVTNQVSHYPKQAIYQKPKTTIVLENLTAIQGGINNPLESSSGFLSS